MVDLVETDTAYQIVADLPGVRHDYIHMRLQRLSVYLSEERKDKYLYTKKATAGIVEKDEWVRKPALICEGIVTGVLD